MLRDKMPPFDQVKLPEGNYLENWQVDADYKKTYYVDQNHPKASDRNDGSEEAPFKTIQMAAAWLGAGEQVLIKNGLYREWVRPPRGGHGPDSMIKYAAYPGHKPVIRGSKPITADWEKTGKASDKGLQTWKVLLPMSFFEQWSPLMMENLTDAQFYGMMSHFTYYYENFRGKEPYTHRRALLFVDDVRFEQVKSLKALEEKTGQYMVEDCGRIIHISMEAGRDPNQAMVEVSHVPHCFAPDLPGINYVHVSGLTMEHAGNGFAYPMLGAVSPNFGHHWIFEDNTIRLCNGAGLDVGVQYNRPSAFYMPSGGGYIIRGNTIENCGFAGLLGSHVEDTVVEFNTIRNCPWFDTELYYENGAIKFLINKNVLVRGNIIYNIKKANAIWMDWACVNCRVTGNITHDVSSMFGAIFFEASRVPNLVDNNLVWNVEGNGIYQHDCDELIVAHNTIGNCSGYGVLMWMNADRNVLGKMSDTMNNKVYNNLVYECAGAAFSINDRNEAWGNYLIPSADQATDVENKDESVALFPKSEDEALFPTTASDEEQDNADKEEKEKGYLYYEAKIIDLKLDFDPDKLVVTLEGSVPKTDLDKIIVEDFYGGAREKLTPVGAFTDLKEGDKQLVK